MCLAVMARRPASRLPLVLASNRDEFHDRPAAPLDWWVPPASPVALLSGRDLDAGGTWLGVTRTGRLALLTNVREPLARTAGAPSRGHIVCDWLSGQEPAEAFARRTQAGGHAGFNAIVIDARRDEALWFSNRTDQPKALGSGIVGLSNAALDTPWPKVRRLKAAMAAVLDDPGLDADAAQVVEPLLAALRDRQPAPDAELPDTGVGLARERGLSPPFIALAGPTGEVVYGTRCSTIVVVERLTGGQRLQVVEQTYARDGSVSERRQVVVDAWPGP